MGWRGEDGQGDYGGARVGFVGWGGRAVAASWVGLNLRGCWGEGGGGGARVWALCGVLQVGCRDFPIEVVVDTIGLVEWWWVTSRRGGQRSRRALAMRASGPWSDGVEGSWWSWRGDLGYGDLDGWRWLTGWSWRRDLDGVILTGWSWRGDLGGVILTRVVGNLDEGSWWRVVGDLDEVDVTPSFAEVFRSVLYGVGGSTGSWRCCWGAPPRLKLLHQHEVLLLATS